jgi:2-polyprenyl-3-methyl-5-hydroxy-6-metoxy-1,4-benzoquinol methylase
MSLAATPLSPPEPEALEVVACYLCGSDARAPFLSAQDDLTGKPGTFHFVRCEGCGLSYQHPRIPVERIKAYYDDEYIAHRKKKDWGVLTPFYNYVMDTHDRHKERIVRQYVDLGPGTEVLDVGCAVGTFLQKLRKLHRVSATGVDFKDLRGHEALAGVDFRCGLFYEQDFGKRRFDLITMWHFLEHDYDPVRTLVTARGLLAKEGRLVIEVPRLDSNTFRLYGDRWPGLQAPQHTALYDKEHLLRMVRNVGLEVVDYLPYGAFPAYFYLFSGAAFRILKGKGLNLSKAIYPYFLGQVALAPVLLFEKQLNLAMQTVVCRRP